MYRYDWCIEAEVYDKKIKNDKLIEDFRKTLRYLDNSNIKKTCGDIALSVIRDGSYYCVAVPGPTGVSLQELLPEYCRSRYTIGAHEAIQFNMKYFDDKFQDVNYRLKVLKLFPEDFQKGYVLYKQGKLPPEFSGDQSGWYLLTPGTAFKFSFDNGEVPMFANAIPAILDLEAAQELDRRKQMQKLLKIIVQKLPMDKNGDLIFDVDEAKDLHDNAVQMLARAIGVDVMTTFADVDEISVSDNTTSTTKDDLEKVERTVYNNLGISQNLFNTDGNLSLEKSILNDEGNMRSLLLQFISFYDIITQEKSPNKKKYTFRFYMLETTQYNYKEISKMYKEHMQAGFSKMLPQIALGHSQSFILNSIYFENEVLELYKSLIPPMLSSTMNSDVVLGKTGNSSSNKSQDTVESTGGRPEKPEGEKSDKTLANQESMN